MITRVVKHAVMTPVSTAVKLDTEADIKPTLSTTICCKLETRCASAMRCPPDCRSHEVRADSMQTPESKFIKSHGDSPTQPDPFVTDSVYLPRREHWHVSILLFRLFSCSSAHVQ